jgi:hypothetical protein
MDKKQIEEWIAHPNAALNRMTIQEFKALCDLALSALQPLPADRTMEPKVLKGVRK